MAVPRGKGKDRQRATERRESLQNFWMERRKALGGSEGKVRRQRIQRRDIRKMLKEERERED